MARNISCVGVGTVNASFKPHSSLTQDDIGKAVTMTGDNEVGLGANQDELVGRLAFLDDNATPAVCTVQIDGVMELPFSGTPSINDKVVVDGAGNVATAPLMAAGQPNKGRGLVFSVGTSKLILGV